MEYPRLKTNFFMQSLSRTEWYFQERVDHGKLYFSQLASARVSYHARRWYVHVASSLSPGSPLPSGACLGSL